MGPASGTQNASLDVPAHLAKVWAALEANAGEFDFFQAVRLLQLCQPHRDSLAGSGGPNREPVRFCANNEFEFPPAQIEDLDLKATPTRMKVNFMGLTGTNGALPFCYTELVADRGRQGDTALRDFLDLFNHRAVALFYSAWERYRFDVAFERDAADRLSQYLFALLGMSTAGLRDRQAVPDHALLFYTGLLGLQARSAQALESILADYFEIPVRVTDFVGGWQMLRPADRSAVDDTSTTSQLGVSAVVGDAVWDEQSRVRLTLGPLSRGRYQEFLPEGRSWKPLRSLVSFFCGPEVEVEVQLCLKREDVPGCELPGPDGASIQLGWTSWIKSKPNFDRDPGDTILRLQ